MFRKDNFLKEENKLIEETGSIIGQSNCSLSEETWFNSIFIHPPSKDMTPFIIGAILGIILIASTIAMVFRLKQNINISVPTLTNLKSEGEQSGENTRYLSHCLQYHFNTISEQLLLLICFINLLFL